MTDPAHFLLSSEAPEHELEGTRCTFRTPPDFCANAIPAARDAIITVPFLKDIQNQAPQAICELKTTNASTNLLVNRDAAPFSNADLRRAMALALDRKTFIDIVSDGKAKVGGAMPD